MNRRKHTVENTKTGTSMSALAPLYAPSSDDEEDSIPLRILSSTMRRSAETAEFIDHESRPEQLSALNPLDKGDFAGMELEELQVSNPNWYENLHQEPFHTRFPGGECYRDLIERLGPVIIDIEQQVNPTLVVSHVSILQLLIAYFRGTPVERCMSIEVPLHTVFKFSPSRGGGWSESVHRMQHAEPESGLPSITSESEFSQISLGASTNSLQPFWGDHMKFKVPSPRPQRDICQPFGTAIQHG